MIAPATSENAPSPKRVLASFRRAVRRFMAARTARNMALLAGWALDVKAFEALRKAAANGEAKGLQVELRAAERALGRPLQGEGVKRDGRGGLAGRAGGSHGNLMKVRRKHGRNAGAKAAKSQPK